MIQLKIYIKKLKNKFSRKKLLSERKSNRTLIGYARAFDGEVNYLNEQIDSLSNFGCNKIFSEILSLSEEEKPQLNNAFDSLASGDIFVIDKFDRVFNSKKHCIKVVSKLLHEGIYLKTLSSSFNSVHNNELFLAIFNVLMELNNLEADIMEEKKKEMIKNKKDLGENLGGRPKINPLKESLVLRLREEGFSYRTIRSQTGVALSTIRRIIIDSQH